MNPNSFGPVHFFPTVRAGNSALTSFRTKSTSIDMTDADIPLNIPNDPLEAFENWLGDATKAGLPEPTAMTLATSSLDGKPDARIVLFKGFSAGAFAFYTNYTSRKARELDANPRAALVFHWVTLKRQVRVEGRVERVPNEESDAYFASRPRGSQIGAWSSPQSQVIDGRETLIDLVKQTEARFGSGPVARPEFWGGYRVVPERIEFWEERPSRLHERHLFEFAGGKWKRSRLAP